jgi:ATP-dependent RNA helicase DDX18/HAS1
MKDVYDINKLDLAKVCRSFGFVYPPFVNLNIRIDPESKRKQKIKQIYGNKQFHDKVNFKLN